MRTHRSMIVAVVLLAVLLVPAAAIGGQGSKSGEGKRFYTTAGR